MNLKWWARGWMWTFIVVLGVLACGEDEPTGVKEEPPIDMVEESADEMSRTTQCDSLRVSSDHYIVASLFARGDQVYRWDGASWVFVEPVAKLYLTRFSRVSVGTHYAGPTWETRRGSKVTGAVVRRCPVEATSIPWLLLQATPATNRGIFAKVDFIQRVNTAGGVAPGGAGTSVGEIRKVPYTAVYKFYRGK